MFGGPNAEMLSAFRTRKDSSECRWFVKSCRMRCARVNWGDEKEDKGTRGVEVPS
jgi:hypothetical protein